MLSSNSVVWEYKKAQPNPGVSSKKNSIFIRSNFFIKKILRNKGSLNNMNLYFVDKKNSLVGKMVYKYIFKFFLINYY